MTFQHQGVDASLLIGERTEGDGARDICRAILILCATVEQQQTLSFQRNVRLGRWLVVDDGPMLLIGRDGVEGDILEQRLLTSKGLEFLGYGKF